jgi:plastocyanin
MKIAIRVLSFVTAVAALAACSGDTNANDASTDTGANDSGATDATAEAGPIDAGQPFMAFRPCDTAEVYVEGSTVTFDNSLLYHPECIFIRAGGTVTFNGDFGMHPLQPSTRGTTGSPITATNTGMTATFTFPTPGFYPYYCLFHGADVGAGMSGVVQVGPN